MLLYLLGQTRHELLVNAPVHCANDQHRLNYYLLFYVHESTYDLIAMSNKVENVCRPITTESLNH